MDEAAVFILLSPASEVLDVVANDIYGKVGQSSTIPIGYFMIRKGYNYEIEMKKIIDSTIEKVIKSGLKVKLLAADTAFNKLLLKSDNHGISNNIVGVKLDLMMKYRLSFNLAISKFIDTYLHYKDFDKGTVHPFIPNFEEYKLLSFTNDKLLC